jgi:hypothetical protein
MRSMSAMAGFSSFLCLCLGLFHRRPTVPNTFAGRVVNDLILSVECSVFESGQFPYFDGDPIVKDFSNLCYRKQNGFVLLASAVADGKLTGKRSRQMKPLDFLKI